MLGTKYQNTMHIIHARLDHNEISQKIMGGFNKKRSWLIFFESKKK